MRPAKALRELDHECAWGCKRNSQGNVQFWKGYKLHLDVTDMGIPVTAVVTGAYVDDSQVAIPMEKLTASRVTHLYSLMDSAYDAANIRSNERRYNLHREIRFYTLTLRDPELERTKHGTILIVRADESQKTSPFFQSVHIILDTTQLGRR